MACIYCIFKHNLYRATDRFNQGTFCSSVTINVLPANEYYPQLTPQFQNVTILEGSTQGKQFDCEIIIYKSTVFSVVASLISLTIAAFTRLKYYNTA